VVIGERRRRVTLGLCRAAAEATWRVLAAVPEVVTRLDLTRPDRSGRAVAEAELEATKARLAAAAEAAAPPRRERGSRPPDDKGVLVVDVVVEVDAVVVVVVAAAALRKRKSCPRPDPARSRTVALPGKPAPAVATAVALPGKPAPAVATAVPAVAVK
jgi:hypothetical protein